MRKRAREANCLREPGALWFTAADESPQYALHIRAHAHQLSASIHHLQACRNGNMHGSRRALHAARTYRMNATFTSCSLRINDAWDGEHRRLHFSLFRMSASMPARVP